MKIYLTVALSSVFFLMSCAQNHLDEKKTTAPQIDKTLKWDGKPVNKTDTEWETELSEMQYYILREQGTERQFTGEYWNLKDDGNYHCAACGLALFSSDTKFKSGTGWPSFFEPIVEGNVGENTDETFGMTRTEVVCNRCDGHLGHVFGDGPQPTGLRYCINSASLHFEPKKKGN